MLIGRYLAMLDANVLHSSFTRSALLWFSAERLLRPAWSKDILREMRTSMKAQHPDLTDQQVDAIQQVMTEQFPDAEVDGYDRLIQALELPDPDDRHVLAAAIVGKCHGIVTSNLKDFPAGIMSDFRMEIVHPDTFIVNVIDLHRGRALAACKRHREAMSRSRPTQDEYLDHFLRCDLVQAHARLSENKDLL